MGSGFPKLVLTVDLSRTVGAMIGGMLRYEKAYCLDCASAEEAVEFLTPPYPNAPPPTGAERPAAIIISLRVNESTLRGLLESNPAAADVLVHVVDFDEDHFDDWPDGPPFAYA